MITFISPAKGFKDSNIKAKSKPNLISFSMQIMDELRKLSTIQISTLMKINENIASINKERFDNFDFSKDNLPAIYAYDGLQYKYMSLDDFDAKDINFAQKHLRIISGLYGCLRPLDAISPYRLEMMTKLQIKESKNLYDFWSDKIFEQIQADLGSPKYIVNLASDEYSKIVKKYAQSSDLKFISCTFKVDKSGKLKTESTASKMARGKMVNFIIKNRIKSYKKLKDFNEDGYEFRPDLSCEKGNIIEYIFVKSKSV